ncbi:conserved protein of unknown function [Ectopseudomonas oleovorans]|uniref:Uncharacterized protein n=1 Tax=Ectopseudomonas oleovorans TaxID=301 RepID=A0A653AZU6_ECTOL|nr:conserved protein of unknown function [Pseudomonas oleovorans]
MRRVSRRPCRLLALHRAEGFYPTLGGLCAWGVLCILSSLLAATAAAHHSRDWPHEASPTDY